MKRLFFLFSMIVPFSEGVLIESLYCQKSSAVKVEMSSDTVGMNGYLEVTFVVENQTIKKFNPPSFEGFDVQGPSTSSMMSIVNGETTQRVSYTYILTPKQLGKLTIGSANIETKEGVLKTEKQQVVAIEYFEFRRPQSQRRGFFDEEENFFRPFSSRPPQEPENKKKKYSTEKI